MKILHVGDIAFVASTLSRRLNQKKHAALVLSKAKGELAYKSSQNIKVARNIFDELNLCRENLNAYDIIHDHYLINYFSLGLRLKNVNKPIVLHCHGSDTRPKNIIEKGIQRFVTGNHKFLLYSTPDLLENIQWFKGRCIYLPNPVDISDIAVQDRNKQERVLIFGTLNRLKETENLIGLIARSNLQLDIIDVGPDRKYFKHKMPKNVKFIKPVAQDEVTKLLSGYALVIGASQDGTIRTSELQSMALGIPTLFPFRYNDFYNESLPMPDDWQNNFEQYLGDRALGERQRQWVDLYHSTPVVVDQLVDIYNRIRSDS